MWSFKDIEGRIWDRICGWKEKFLSQAGKEVLFKAVLQAIPTYTMSVFQLPKILCKRINSMLQRFWLGHKENLSKVAWMRWERMGRAKGLGGLGFRDIECFNKALLAKQGWRLIQFPDSLVAQVLKAKYYPRAYFLESDLGSHPSFAWRSIWKAKELLQEGLVWRVGDGTSINIWGERWIPSPTTYSIQSPVRILPSNAKVSSLIEWEKRCWNVPLLQACSIIICPGQQPDVKVWAGTKSGEFTVKSAYHLAREVSARGEGGCSSGPQIEEVWKQIWSLRSPRVVQFFLWKACQNILPTKANLYKRNLSLDPLCPICGRSEETVCHILWHCPSTHDVWSECSPKIQKPPSFDEDFGSIAEIILEWLDEA